MSKTYRIKKGFDIGLAGRPLTELSDASAGSTVAVYPLEYTGFKQRLKVTEGDAVKRGTELLENKKNVRLKICSPASGKIKKIIRGERRFVEKIIIETDESGEAERFGQYTADKISGLSKDDVINQLLSTGYMAFIRQRPFGGIADPEASPKSVFVNAMNTGPFQVDATVAVGVDAEGFQAGLDILTRLTDGAVHLCVGPEAGEVLKQASNVQVHVFKGKHPAGNTSVHISKIEPMASTDVVWTAKAVDVVLIGRLFLDGELPTTRVIAIGGPGVKKEFCKHYRVNIGGELGGLLSDALVDGEQRLINGDALTGETVEASPSLRLQQSALTVVPEGRTRQFLGWVEPGFNQMSFSRLCASTFIGGRNRKWKLDTNTHGGVRAMVFTGYYDKVMPMNIMVDYLVRAVLAGDTDESISHGILETLPEDYALCEFICPCKMELQEIIADGLKMIEEEGI